MFCPKCGMNISDNMQFCPSCGEKIYQSNNSIQQQKIEGTKSRKTKMIIAIIIMFSFIVLAVIAVLLGLFINKHNSKPQSSQKEEIIETEKGNDENEIKFNSSIQANLSNWSMACEVGDSYFFSDFKTGIYMENDTVRIADGVYSDLCHLQGKLFCIEYNYDNETFENSYNLVIIDIKTREKTVAYSSTGDNYLLISNVIDDKVYFVISDSELVSCDINGNIEYLYIFNVLKATDNGVYTTQHGDCGLQLMGYNNKLIKKFDTLSENKVTVFFEYDDYIYARFYNENKEKWVPIRINAKTGEYETIGNVDKKLAYMNFHNDKLYLIYIDDDNETYSIYECDFNGDNMIEYSQYFFPENNITELIVISVVNDTLIQSFPYTSIPMRIHLLTN